MQTDRIERDMVIEAPAERVWAALTEQEHIAEWFGDAGAQVDLRPGGQITFSWQKHGSVSAVIERLDPPRHFSYRWAVRTDEAPRAGNSTLVEFTLEDHERGTRLRLVESGFDALDMPEEERVRRLGENVSGWTAELQELVEYLERQAV